ncbi:Rieske domain-containing protein [Trichostrongylus colubriformis]|uniref:cholesterol 7-desaturase n=1 Tax=Trichostrongylus colubriformis TaxID=6319 RepID=A0AAN8IVP5_TRICO
MTVILISIAVATLLVVIYTIYYALRPCNRIRKLGDLGLLLGDPELKGVYRERQITRLAKLRRLGELPPVYPNGWYCIAESDELKPKAVREITVFGQFLTLIRSESGQVYLIDSYCPHLGANFNVGGKVVDDNCVQCPFHGWVFSAETGKCTRIPYDSGTIPEQAKVAVWPVQERNQHIYVWYHCDGNDPEWEIPEIDEHGPGIVHMLFDFGVLGRGVVLQHVTPQEPLQQLVRFKLYSTVPRWFAKFFLTSEATQFERDIWIWSNKKYIKNPLVVRNDGPIQKHRRWFSQFYKENSPRLLPNGDISNRPKSIYDW